MSEWQLVHRRKGKTPATAQPSSSPQPNFKPYIPYQPKPLYSQVLLSKPPQRQAQNHTSSTHLMATNSPPSSPPQTKPTWYISPHSPTQLRFPPSAQYPEWKGRCFRCCRSGHNSTVCRNPMRCGKCWGEGHTGLRCQTKMLNPAALPYWSSKTKQPPQQAPFKKSFEDLLLKPCPLSGPTMPANRPTRLAYFADRDPAFLQEMEKLNNGVVFDTHGHELDFTPRDVANFALRTRLVQESDITIGILARDRFLIILPAGVAPETFINKTSPELWDAGFSFQPWSPLDGARLVLPEYKALLTLTNVPPLLRREKDIAGVISTFGIYLGLVQQEDPPNLSVWTAAVAVDRLERIPELIDMYAGGLEFTVSVLTKNWIRSPLYSPADLPKHKPKFSKPLCPGNGDADDQEELIPISRNVLRLLCSGVDQMSLPVEIRAILQSKAVPAITMSQATFLAELQDGGSLEGHLCNTQPGEAGQSSTMIDPPQEDALFQPQHTANKEPLGLPESEMTTHDPEASHESRKQVGDVANPQSATWVGKQKTCSPVRILQRQSPQNDTQVLIPQSCNTVQGNTSVVSRQPQSIRRQLMRHDNPEPSHRRQGAGPTKTQADKRVASNGPRRGVQKPKKTLVLPPKHVAFKKSAQQSKTRPKIQMLEAARRAEISFNKEDLYEVRVQYGLCEDIAAGSGLKLSDVEQALAEDNQQRREALQAQDEAPALEMDPAVTGPTNEGPELDLDSQDDYESDEEMI